MSKDENFVNAGKRKTMLTYYAQLHTGGVYYALYLSLLISKLFC